MLGCHQHARSADAALRSAALQERLVAMDVVRRGASPSTVSMAAPSACKMGTRQLKDQLTVHAQKEQEPHSPSPHPSLVPVSLRSSRSTSSRRFIGGTQNNWRVFTFTFELNCGEVTSAYTDCRPGPLRWNAELS